MTTGEVNAPSAALHDYQLTHRANDGLCEDMKMVIATFCPLDVITTLGLVSRNWASIARDENIVNPLLEGICKAEDVRFRRVIIEIEYLGISIFGVLRSKCLIESRLSKIGDFIEAKKTIRRRRTRIQRIAQQTPNTELAITFKGKKIIRNPSIDPSVSLELVDIFKVVDDARAFQKTFNILSCWHRYLAVRVHDKLSGFFKESAYRQRRMCCLNFLKKRNVRKRNSLYHPYKYLMSSLHNVHSRRNYLKCFLY